MKINILLVALLCLTIGFILQWPGDVLSQEATGTSQAPPTATLPPPPNSRPTVAPPPPTMPQPTALPPTIPAPPNPRPDGLPSLTPALPGITPTIMPPIQDGWTTYADTDPLLNYAKGNWQTLTIAEAMGGTVTSVDTPRAYLSVYFEGTGIRIIHSAGPEGSSFTARLDSQPEQTGSAYFTQASYGHQFVFENLTPGVHELTIVNGPGTFQIEGIQVQGHLTEAPTLPQVPQPSIPDSDTSATGTGAVRTITSWTDGPHYLPYQDDLLYNPPDLDETELADIGFQINFFNTNYSQLYVDINGYVAFDHDYANVDLPAYHQPYRPVPLDSTGFARIAPFWADISTEGGSPSANTVEYGRTNLDGQAAFAVTWRAVDCTNRVGSYNTFQLILIEQPGTIGDYMIEFNYDTIEWEAGGISGGDANCIINPNNTTIEPPRAGFGDGATAATELPGSGDMHAFLDIDPTTGQPNNLTGLIYNSLNSSQLGRYRWCFGVKSCPPESNPNATLTLNFDGFLGAEPYLDGATVDVETGDNYNVNYQTTINDTAAGPDNTEIGANQEVRVKITDFPDIPPEYEDIVQVHLEENIYASASSRIGLPTPQPPPSYNIVKYTLANAGSITGLEIPVSSVDGAAYNGTVEVRLCRFPTQQGGDGTATPAGLPPAVEALPLCNVGSRLVLDFQWETPYPDVGDFHGSSVQVDFPTITIDQPIAGNTTGPIAAAVTENDIVSINLHDLPGIPTEYSDQIRVGLRPIDGPIDPNGNTFMSVVEPYWYLLSDWEADPGLPVTIPPVDLVTGNYLVGIEVSLCETSAGPGLPPCQVEPTATLTPTPTPDASVYNCTGSVVCPTGIDPVNTAPICSLQVKQGVFISLYFDPYTAMNDPGSPAIFEAENRVAPLAYWVNAGGSILFIRGRDHNNDTVWGWTNTASRVAWYDNTLMRVLIPGQDDALITACQNNVAVVNQQHIPTLTPTLTPSLTPTITPGGPTLTPTPTQTFTPTPSPTADNSQLPGVLATYGVYVAIDDFDPNSMTHEHFRREVLEGVQDTAFALNHKFPRASPDSSSISTFLEIMVNDTPADKPVAFVFHDRQSGSGNLTCQTHNVLNLSDPDIINLISIINAQRDSEEADPFPSHEAIIECDTTFAMNFTQYAVTHELGHVFTEHTGGFVEIDDNNNLTYFGHHRYPGGLGSENQDVEDSLGFPVMGIVDSTAGSNWTRGGPITAYPGVNGDATTINLGRGWGSSARVQTDSTSGLIITPDIACIFQQNPANPFGLAPPELFQYKLDEAAADMFLNWVYEVRERQLGMSSIGFEDIDWTNGPDCNVPPQTEDLSFPGETRFNWMEDILAQIGAVQQWN